jgi:ABC-type nickel/cobalt efflux system permease component RcnA
MTDENLSDYDKRARSQGRNAAIINGMAALGLLSFVFFVVKSSDKPLVQAKEMLTIAGVSIAAFGVLWIWSMLLTFKALPNDLLAQNVRICGFVEVLVLIIITTH